MIRVRIIDNKDELLSNQLIDFGKVLQNALATRKYSNQFSVEYIENLRHLCLFINDNEIIFDARWAPLKESTNYNEIIHTNVIDDFEGDKRVLVVDYGLIGQDQGAEMHFYTSLLDHCDYALVTTGWSNLDDEMMRPLEEAGYYFIRRAASEPNSSNENDSPEKEYSSLNWRASTIVDYNPEYKNEIKKMKNTILRKLCLDLIKTDNVNLRYFATIILLVGKSVDDLSI